VETNESLVSTPDKTVVHLQLAGLDVMTDARNVRFLPQQITVQFAAVDAKWVLSSVTVAGAMLRKNGSTLTSRSTSRLWHKDSFGAAPWWVIRIVNLVQPKFTPGPHELVQVPGCKPGWAVTR
jgi:hypothetical protein